MIELKVEQRMKILSFVEFFGAHYCRVELGLGPSSAAALNDISYITKNGQNNLCHLRLTSYDADLLDVKSMLSAKRGSYTDSPRHSCFVARHQMPQCAMERYQTRVSHTKLFWKALRSR